MAEHRTLVIEETGLAVEQPIEQVSGAFVFDPELGSASQSGAKIVSCGLSETVEFPE